MSSLPPSPGEITILDVEERDDEVEILESGPTAVTDLLRAAMDFSDIVEEVNAYGIKQELLGEQGLGPLVEEVQEQVTGSAESGDYSMKDESPCRRRAARSAAVSPGDAEDILEDAEVTLEITDYNIKKEVEDVAEVSAYFGDLLSEVKVEPETIMPGQTVLALLAAGEVEDDDIVFLPQVLHPPAEDLVSLVSEVSRCTDCFLSFPSPSQLAQHMLQHRAPPRLSLPQQHALASSPVPRLTLYRAPLPTAFKRKRQEEAAASSMMASTAAPAAAPMTTLQALDSLLAEPPRAATSGPGPEFSCAVCSKDSFTSMAALRKHLAYHPHS